MIIFDYRFQEECAREQNFEKLEMYVPELLMGLAKQGFQPE
jgi:hypothetical protein